MKVLFAVAWGLVVAGYVVKDWVERCIGYLQRH
jgi:hypothetical protein